MSNPFSNEFRPSTVSSSAETLSTVSAPTGLSVCLAKGKQKMLNPFAKEFRPVSLASTSVSSSLLARPVSAPTFGSVSTTVSSSAETLSTVSAPTGLSVCLAKGKQKMLNPFAKEFRPVSLASTSVSSSLLARPVSAPTFGSVSTTVSADPGSASASVSSSSVRKTYKKSWAGPYKGLQFNGDAVLRKVGPIGPNQFVFAGIGFCVRTPKCKASGSKLIVGKYKRVEPVLPFHTDSVVLHEAEAVEYQLQYFERRKKSWKNKRIRIVYDCKVLRMFFNDSASAAHFPPLFQEKLEDTLPRIHAIRARYPPDQIIINWENRVLNSVADSICRLAINLEVGEEAFVDKLKMPAEVKANVDRDSSDHLYDVPEPLRGTSSPPAWHGFKKCISANDFYSD